MSAKLDPRQKDPDVQYKNFAIINNSNSLQLARQDITYSSPIISDCSKYYLWVSRFAISHMAIPIYFFDNSDAKYSVTVEYQGEVPNTTPLVYIPVGNYSGFGYTQPVFYYEQFAQMVNVALRASALASVAPPANNQQIPFIKYNANTGKFSLYVNQSVVTYDPLVDGIVRPLPPPAGDVRIYFSPALFQQLQFFKATFSGNFASPFGYELDLSVPLAGLNIYEDPYEATAGLEFYYVYEQEREALYLLNDIQSITFISNKIPTTKEYIPNLQNSNVLTSRSILCNFIPDLSQGRNLSEYQYYPQGQPFLINMESSQPLSTIDVQIYFVTKNEIFYPLYLEPGEAINIKFAFYKKSIYNNAYTSLLTDKLQTGY
jgi:hypothetical protein